MAVEQKTIERLILKHIKLMSEIHIISLETSTQLIEPPESPDIRSFPAPRRVAEPGRPELPKQSNMADRKKISAEIRIFTRLNRPVL